jgi:hypothetical protein
VLRERPNWVTPRYQFPCHDLTVIERDLLTIARGSRREHRKGSLVHVRKGPILADVVIVRFADSAERELHRILQISSYTNYVTRN